MSFYEGKGGKSRVLVKYSILEKQVSDLGFADGVGCEFLRAKPFLKKISSPNSERRCCLANEACSFLHVTQVVPFDYFGPTFAATYDFVMNFDTVLYDSHFMQSPSSRGKGS